MLLELDVPHERVVVDLAAGQQNSPEYRAINPMGKVPALVDGDVIVTETAAICAYLADRFPHKGLAPSHTAPERGRYYRYLFFPGTTLEPLLSVTALGVAETRPQSMGWGDMPRVLATIDAMTPEASWALGTQFSAADVVFGGALALFSDFGLLDASPKVERYLTRVKARPAYSASHPDR
jgi:glutathione S-transferase